MTTDKVPAAELARRMALAEEAVATDPTLGGLLEEPMTLGGQKTFMAAELRDAIVATVDLPVSVEQTGGGVATIYVGYAGPDGRYTLAIGPGSYRPVNDGWNSLFSMDELAVGPDDEGEATPTYVESLEALRAAVKTTLLDLDERFATVLERRVVKRARWIDRLANVDTTSRVTGGRS